MTLFRKVTKALNQYDKITYTSTLLSLFLESLNHKFFMLILLFYKSSCLLLLLKFCFLGLDFKLMQHKCFSHFLLLGVPLHRLFFLSKALLCFFKFCDLTSRVGFFLIDFFVVPLVSGSHRSLLLKL